MRLALDWLGTSPFIMKTSSKNINLGFFCWSILFFSCCFQPGDSRGVCLEKENSCYVYL